MRTLALPLAACLAATTFAREAAAAPPWVERGLTLPGGDVAFDLGTGLVLPPPTGAGLNLEMGIGLSSRIELGFRTALRFGDVSERAREPDVYARLFDRQTFDAGGGVANGEARLRGEAVRGQVGELALDTFGAGGSGVVANPEIRLRGELVRGEVGELALEGRLVLPFEAGTRLGLMFGMPVALHLGDRVRLDTGGYVPLVGGPPWVGPPPRTRAESARSSPSASPSTSGSRPPDASGSDPSVIWRSMKAARASCSA